MVLRAIVQLSITEYLVAKLRYTYEMKRVRVGQRQPVESNTKYFCPTADEYDSSSGVTNKRAADASTAARTSSAPAATDEPRANRKLALRKHYRGLL